MPKKNQKQKNQKNKMKRIRPMLATLTDQPFDSKDYVYEIKWDGYRALASIKNGVVDLYSRNLKDFSGAYPAVVRMLERIKDEVILDGEIIAYTKKGVPSFQLLQNLGSDNKVKLDYVLFDLLHLNGKSLLNLPLIKRKEFLRSICEKYSLTFSEHVEEKGTKLFQVVVKKNIEGVMAKEKNSLYLPGYRSESWLKIKHHKTEEGIIVGFTAPRGTRSHFGALVLAQYRGNDELIFIGHTGTGFDHETLSSLYKKMRPLTTKTSPFKKKIPLNAPITWIKPKLVAELKFTEWTTGGVMRHPVFLGLREDKNAKEIKPEASLKFLAPRVPRHSYSGIGEGRRGKNFREAGGLK
jgi:bifunctional non-homologous end joining protein LigD